ncbi:MAG: hypothetical protein JWN44_3495 [Myxococcales bacterium]|nr:hypothetical protein [Myxococcales bacterium]
MTATRLLCCALIFLVHAGCGGGDGAGGPPTVSADLTGINLNPRFRDPSVTGSNAGYASPADLVAIGIARVRFEYILDDAEDLNEAFSRYDPIIDEYLLHGIEVLVILDHATVKLDGSADDVVAAGGWNAYVARFQTVTELIVGHYAGRVDAYEIWNEENGQGKDFMHVPPAAYSQLLLAAATTINGRATVVAGGLFWKDVDFGDSAQPSYLGQLPDGIVADAIATHPYFSWPGGVDDMPDEVRNDAIGWDTMDDHLASLAGYGLPVWITEWGTPSQTLLPQLIRAFYTHAPAVERSYFFAWSDAMKDGHGLTYADGHTPKPALGELQQELANEQAAQPRIDLHGTVVDADSGAPIAPPYRATVYLDGLAGVRTADDGSFTVANLRPGSYPALIAGSGGDGAYGVSTVVVAAGSGEVTLPLPRDPLDAATTGGTVRGSVYDARTGKPIAAVVGVLVGCGGVVAKVASDGTYHLDNVRPGARHIVATNLFGQRVYHDWAWTAYVSAGTTSTQDITLVR